MSKLRATLSPSKVAAPPSTAGELAIVRRELCVFFFCLFLFLFQRLNVAQRLRYRPRVSLKISCEREVFVSSSCDQRPRSVPSTYQRSTFSRYYRGRDTYLFTSSK
uniref:Uncharacterized protein n=1 Tax=Schizaphis graminum TaxID=13262 RepID=A0A2S2PA92_SCHGA